MNPLIMLLLSRLVEFLCKRAEEKFQDAKAGADKKAYVLQKVDQVLDVNEEGVEDAKADILNFVSEKIEDVVEKVINRK